MHVADLAEKKILILGLGANNWEVSRFLLEKGFPLTIRDRNPEVKERFLQQFPLFTQLITWEIGEKILLHLEKFHFIFRTPAIPFLTPELQQAVKKGVQLYSQTKLFFDLCPATIIGVTGSKGKGTTCTLLRDMLEQGYQAGKVYLGGNIGLDPFSFLSQLQPPDLVILELSSFQLQDLHKSPQLAIILRITPEHLDHHKQFAEYVEAKRQIVAHQLPGDRVVANADSAEAVRVAKSSLGVKYWYSFSQPRRQAAWLDASTGKEVAFVQIEDKIHSIDLTGRTLRGKHNIENILPALLVGCLYDVPIKQLQHVLTTYVPLPHRLALVGTFGGVSFYDDSIGTTPEACMAAIESFPKQTVHLILGGTEKVPQDYTHFARIIVQQCKSVSILPGQLSKKIVPLLRKAIKEQKSTCLLLDKAQDPLMPTILSGIQPHLKEGEVVLLAPAAASFASFKNYAERGDAFIAAVKGRYNK